MLSLVDKYIEGKTWKLYENANRIFCIGGCKTFIAEEVIREYTLRKLPPEAARAHKDGAIHIHDLAHGIAPYCAAFSLLKILLEGLRDGVNTVHSRPPKHLSSAAGIMVNAMGLFAQEWAGAIAFNSIDTLLAPFVYYDKLSYKQVKQEIQELVFGLNQSFRFGHETPFTNFTFDVKVPDDLAGMPAIVGGKPMDRTYAEFDEERQMITKAFLEVLIAGDGRGGVFRFPIPTFNIVKDFPWDTEVGEKLAEVAGRFGLPYFQNCISSGISPTTVRSLCCRLQLDLSELKRKSGGLFGYNDETGSIGVVTINLSQLGYLSHSESEFFERLDEILVIAKEALECKRKIIQKTFDRGLLPYTKRYLRGFDNHFSTIGVIAGEEMCQNLLGCSIATEIGRDFAIQVLKYIRERIREFQEETGNLYNLEATPAEGASYRLARIDRKKFGKKIFVSGTKTKPYYVNCLSEDTEILTDKGWRRIDEVKEDEQALTYNVKKKILEYKPILHIYKFDSKPRRMIRIEHKYVDLLVTPNHFILYSPQGAPHKEVFTFADNLNEHFAIRVSAEWEQEDNKEFSDDFLRLIGWIIAAGHFDKECGAIFIYQSSDSPFLEEIRSILHRLGIDFREYLTETRGFNDKKSKEIVFRIPARFGNFIRKIINKKEIPREILNTISPRQADLLIDAIVKGDGTRYRSYSRIYTMNPKLADQLMELAIKAGRYVAVHDYRGKYEKGSIHVVISNTKRSKNKHYIMKSRHVREEEYYGRVWCVETENRTLIVRRKVGNSYKYCITGNSTHLPYEHNLDLISVLEHQEPLQTLYSGGCIHGDAKVLTDKGLITIKELVERFQAGERFKVASFNKQTLKTEWKNVLNAIPAFPSKAYEIRFCDRTRIITSDYHPFEVLRNGKIEDVRADALKIGDFVVSTTNELSSDEEEKVDKDIAWLLGYFLADGSYYAKNNILEFRAIKDSRPIERVAKILNKLGARVALRKYKEYYLTATSNKDVVEKIISMLPDEIDYSDKAHSAALPKNFRNWDRAAKIALLAGLIDGDGFVCNKKIEICTVSPRMQTELLELLMLLGTSPTCSSKYNKVTIPSADVFLLKRDLIAELTSYKREILESKRYNNPSMQKAVYWSAPRVKQKKWIKAGYQKFILENNIQVPHTTYYRWKRQQRIGISFIMKWRPELTTLLLNGKVVKSVREVDPSEIEFYDLTVEDNQNYLAGENGFVFIHNTILHCYLGEQLPKEECKCIVPNFIEWLCTNWKIPYYTLTPTYSVCRACGKTHSGAVRRCPDCGQSCEIYSRVVGYYSPIQAWNPGKREEFKRRTVYTNLEDAMTP